MPNFVSPGGMAGNAIEQFLMQRAMLERQQQLDALMRQKQEEDTSLRTGDLALRQSQELRQADAQKQAAADLEKERQFRRANTISDNALPGDTVDDATRQLLEGQGFGGQLKKVPGIMSQGPMLEDMSEANGQIPTYGVTQQPDNVTMRGGSKYMAARTAADERSTAAEASRQAADERAAQERDLRRDLAADQNSLRRDLGGATAAGAAETRGLRNDLLRTQVDAATQKRTDADAATARARQNAVKASSDTVDVIKQLADIGPDGKLTLKSGTESLFGARNPLAQYYGEGANAKSALDRLKSRVVLDLISEMKQQSKTGATGFGAMNERELGTLESGASQLGHSMMTDEAALAELQRIYDVAHQGMQGGSSAVSGGAGVEDWVRDPKTGKLVRAK